MTSIRKFAYVALLAFTTLNLAPSLASAQEAARGKFTLTHDVYWVTPKFRRETISSPTIPTQMHAC